MAALTHGPMLRCPSASGFKVWVRADGAAEVTLETRRTGATVWTLRDTQDIDVSMYNTTVLAATGLLPRTAYDYRVLFDGVEVASYSTVTMPPDTGGRFTLYHISDIHQDDTASICTAVLAHWQDNYEASGVPGVVQCIGDLLSYFVPGSAQPLDDATDDCLAEIALTGDCFKYLPLIYQFDDWDWGGNNSAMSYHSFSSDQDPRDNYERLWRGPDYPATPSYAQLYEIAGVPFVVTDQRSQRTQFDNSPGNDGNKQGNEAISDSYTCFGPAQRAWLRETITGYREKGAIFLISGGTWRDNVGVVSTPSPGVTGSPARDSIGIFWKNERNYVVGGLWTWRRNLIVFSGDDHRNSLWQQDLFQPRARSVAGVGTGIGLSHIEVKCVSGADDPVGNSTSIFGSGNRFDWSGVDHDCVVVVDVNSTHAGAHVNFRLRYLHVSGTQSPPGALGVPTDDNGNLADFYFEDGYFNTYDAESTEVSQLFPPENGNTGVTFERWYTDDVSGVLHRRSMIGRDVYERVRYFKDVEDHDRDELLERHNPRIEREPDPL
jgi:hypothetical protein